MQPMFPNPTTPFERDLVLSLTRYIADLYGKVEQQQGYQWDGKHPIMGGYHLWVDSSGRLRIKSSCPTSDTDGTIVGVQS